MSSKMNGMMDSNGCRALTWQTYPLEMYDLPVEFQKKAEKELRETPERKVKKMKELRELIENDGIIDIDWMTDEHLLMFLRGRKFDAQRAYCSLKRLVMFVKNNNNRKFCMALPRSVEIFIRDKIAYYLPYRDRDGCAVYVGFLDRWDPSEIGPDETLACHLQFSTKAFTYPMSQVNGIKLIYDVKSTSLKHLRSCTPYYAYLMCCTLQDFCPARLKGMHMINSSLPFRTFYAIVSPLLPKKLRSRIFVHNSLASLHKHFPAEILPKEFGGTLEYDFSEWARKARHPEPIYRILNST